MEKTLTKISKGIKAGLVFGSLVYMIVNGAAFLGTSQAIREVDNKYNLTKEDRITVNNKNISDYNKRSLFGKVSSWGEYLAYKLYQENLERGQVEGAQ